MIYLNEHNWLVVAHNGRTTPIQPWDWRDGIDALCKLGYSVEVAQVFGHGAEQGRVVALAQRKHLIMKEST
jgi:hypothetical protein